MNEKKNATPAPVKDFEQVKRDFETAHASGKDYGPALLPYPSARPPQTVIQSATTDKTPP